MKISSGVLREIVAGKDPENPVVQLLGIKAIEKKADQLDRYRVLLSDGEYQHSSCMLGTQLNHLVAAQDVIPLSVVSLNKYICNCVDKESAKYVIIILEMTVLSKHCPKLGDPKPLAAVIQAEGLEPKATTQNSKSTFRSSPPKRPFTTNSMNEQNIPQTKQARSNVLMNPNRNKDVDEMYSGHRVFTIDSLNPYQNKWTIKARVTNKIAPRNWSNSRGEGRMFSFDLVDHTSEIRVTAFNEVCDKFSTIIQPNKVYYVSKGTIKPANRNFSTIQNDYEMVLNSDSVVEECHEENPDLPTIQFNFTPIKEIATKNNNQLIDVIAICRSASDIQTIVARQSNREIMKRELNLIDESGASIACTLWGTQAEEFHFKEPVVLVLKGVRVTDFGGRSLSLLNSTYMTINPDIPEANFLKNWFENEGSQVRLVDLSNAKTDNYTTVWKNFGDIKDDGMGFGDKADYFTIKAVIIGSRKDNALYQSCPTPDCNKKVIDQGMGSYRCEKCAKTVNEFKWRLIMQINLADFVDNQWVTCFNETSEQILKTTAEQLGEYKNNSDDTSYEEAFLNMNFMEYCFRLRSKVEMFNDERRLRFTCVSVSPINYSEYGRRLIHEIERNV